MTIHKLIMVVALVVVSANAGGVATAAVPAGLRATGAYAIARRLFLKGAEAAMDATVRQAIAAGGRHEEYELSDTPFSYYDAMWETMRGDQKLTRYRLMWLDPVTQSQNFETWLGDKVVDRFPFYYEFHNRAYYCKSTGDAANGYEYRIHAGTRYRVRDRVVKAVPGQEVMDHPITMEWGLTEIAKDCYGVKPPVQKRELKAGTIVRGNYYVTGPSEANADINSFVVWYVIL